MTQCHRSRVKRAGVKIRNGIGLSSYLIFFFLATLDSFKAVQVPVCYTNRERKKGEITVIIAPNLTAAREILPVMHVAAGVTAERTA